MGQIENMNQDDIDLIKAQIESLNKQRLDTEPQMTFKTFPMDDLDFSKRLAELEKKVDSIITKLNNIFGSSVLINGRFIEVNLKHPTE